MSSRRRSRRFPLSTGAHREHVLLDASLSLTSHARPHSASRLAEAYEALAAEALSLGVPRHALPLGAAGDAAGKATPAPRPDAAALAAAVARLQGIIASRLSSNL